MSDQPDLGGQLEAVWRQGLKDLHNAIVPAFPESQRGVEEPGTPLAPTPQMVSQDLGVTPTYEDLLTRHSSVAVEQEQQKDQGMER